MTNYSQQNNYNAPDEESAFKFGNLMLRYYDMEPFPSMVEVDQNQIKKNFDMAIVAGATRDDITQWWNLSSTERDQAIRFDCAIRKAAFWYYVDIVGVEHTLKKVAETYVVYADASIESVPEEDEKLGFTPEDDVLPWELNRRIARKLPPDSHLTHTEEYLQTRRQGFSTLNAYVRHLLRHGVL